MANTNLVDQLNRLAQSGEADFAVRALAAVLSHLLAGGGSANLSLTPDDEFARDWAAAQKLYGKGPRP